MEEELVGRLRKGEFNSGHEKVEIQMPDEPSLKCLRGLFNH